ncbi:hypothetical protein FXO38_02429 [Capsicum annuum]|nr:hypothetical protein FXO38_02429 [Capsicum annuum]
MYPLCISRIDKSSDNIQLDRNTGVVVCMEGVESGGMALAVTETQNQYALYVPEFEVDNLIYNSKSIDMKVKQMCKDKKTLVSVMEKYVVTHGFNCRAKLSDKKRDDSFPVREAESLVAILVLQNYVASVGYEKPPINLGLTISQEPPIRIRFSISVDGVVGGFSHQLHSSDSLENTTNQQLWWTYEVPIIPMPDKKDYDVPNSVDEEEVSSPIYKRLSERSKKGRKKKSSETLSSSTNCCGHKGHNRHSCYFFPKEK